MGGIIIIGVVWIIFDLIKSASEPTIPAENWKNVGWDLFISIYWFMYLSCVRAYTSC